MDGWDHFYDGRWVGVERVVYVEVQPAHQVQEVGGLWDVWGFLEHLVDAFVGG